MFQHNHEQTTGLKVKGTISIKPKAVCPNKYQYGRRDEGIKPFRRELEANFVVL